MCRPKELGGRRCPQHTDPVKHAAYNARRRELYAKNKSGVNNLKSSFYKPGEPRQFLTFAEYSVFVKETETYESILKDYNATQYMEDFPEMAKVKKKLIGVLDTEDNEDFSKLEYIDTQKALNLYTDIDYESIRDYLNGYSIENYGSPDEAEEGSIPSDEWTDNHNKVMIAALDKALSLAPKAEKPRMLYRGINIPLSAQNNSSGWVDKNFPIGGVISQKSYMSTTLDPAIAGSRFSNSEDSIVLEILSTGGAPLGRETSYWDLDESEILLPREAKLRIVSVEKEALFHHPTYNHSIQQSGNSRIEETAVRTIIQVIHEEEK